MAGKEKNAGFKLLGGIAIGIIFLESLALLKGHNGMMFSSAMVALGIVAGWVCKTFHNNKRR